jgi:hypothetical protein
MQGKVNKQLCVVQKKPRHSYSTVSMFMQTTSGGIKYHARVGATQAMQLILTSVLLSL